jgi:3-oxoacyl-[acyl-carrier protein] reductase
MSTENRKLALITGGTSGIGFGAAQNLASRYNLALGYATNEAKAFEAKKNLSDRFPNSRIEIFPQLLSSPKDAELLYESVSTTFNQPPSVLVSSAGRLSDGLLLQSDFEQFRRIVDEHLVVTMALTQLALKPMYRTKFGRVVLLSSISSFYAKRGQANYAAAKAGLEGFARTIALEVAHRNITVNAIAPGLIETPMTKDLVARIEQNGDLKKRIPAGRLGRADEVGALIAFLCSDQASYITGTVIPIDGGRSLGDPSS